MSNENNTSTEVAETVTGADAVSQLAALQSGVGIWSTVQGTDFASKKVTLAALTNAVPLSEHLGEEIRLVNMIGQVVSLNDEENDNKEVQALRIVLLAEDGTSYAAISKGLAGSLRDIFGILGEPHTWDEPLPIKIVEVRGRSGFRFMKAEIS